MQLHYPVWLLEFFGGGFPIAVMAVVHVYVAHFAVGGGLFLVLTEAMARRQNAPEILAYTKRHARFFLLLSMVFGAITGVGIWFTISLLQPAATSKLIHTFVFGWATEWVFFLGEIVALFIYYYAFEKMEARRHLTVGWIYFIFGWLSLFVINGIICFMLTPGDWLNTNNFWDGFFNPTFWPALFFRTFLAVIFAGLFGFITAIFEKNTNLRQKLTRHCARFLLIPFGFMLLCGWWYISALPEAPAAIIFLRSPEIPPYLRTFLIISPLLFVGGIIMALRLPVAIKKPLAFLLLVIGLMYMGAFEWIREGGRRPYIIYDYMYSNSVLKSTQASVQKKGLLAVSRFVKNKTINAKNQLEAGQEIYRFLCIGCHSTGGIINDILPRTQKFTRIGMEAMLDGMGKLNDYMPPFSGNLAERQALAAYIVNGLHQKPKKAETIARPKPLVVKPQPFDSRKDPYVFLAASGKGMHFVADTNRHFSLSTPGVNFYAQLIRRGETPEIVMDGVRLVYHLVEKPIISGRLEFDQNLGAFVAKEVPLTPYGGKPGFNPYPLMRIEAMDVESGQMLATTTIVAPVSTEMGCKTCHGGSWGVAERTGLNENTAQDILAVHDRINRTNLGKMAATGQAPACQSCHGIKHQDQPGKKNPLNLSAAIHGFHANYLTNRGVDACSLCHPMGAKTFTKGFRGIHVEVGLDCTSCHGALEEHAISLLKAEHKNGKQAAARLMGHLKPRIVESLKQISARAPWVNLPDCLNCHLDFNQPETDQHPLDTWSKSDNLLYRVRTADAGIMCIACHGAPHAIYPAINIFGRNRDNLPPLQYQQNPYPIAADRSCRVCHTIDMEEEIHHPNMLAMFRNRQ